jgi:hypothetical protein
MTTISLAAAHAMYMADAEVGGCGDLLDLGRHPWNSVILKEHVIIHCS